MDRSPGFGSTHSNSSPYSDSVSLRLPYSVKLAAAYNSLTHYTKGTQSLHLRRAPTACTHTVSGSISLPSSGFFSPFPHGTGSLSVSREYLALEDGPPSCPKTLLQTGFLVSRPTFHTPIQSTFRVRDFHPLRSNFPIRSTRCIELMCIGSSAFARRYSRNLTFDFFSSRY